MFQVAMRMLRITPSTGAGGGAGTKNGTVHCGRDSPSILARQTSTRPAGSGSPVLKYSTTWERVGRARRGTPLPRKLGSSICSVWPKRITRDPGTARGLGQLDRRARLVLEHDLERVLLVEQLRRKGQADHQRERRGDAGRRGRGR